MKSRKFYLAISIILAVVLFLTGLFVIFYLNSDSESDSVFGGMLNPFKSVSEPLNILLLGGDKVAKNTDTMMLINFNPSTTKLNVLSIPRDTKVSVKGSSLPKINSAFPIGGANLAIDTVSSFLNVKIKYYVFVDTKSFRKIIDILGGVEINVPVNMDYDDPVQNLHVHLKKGLQTLDGEHAEQFMRFRHYNNNKTNEFYDGSDLKRIDAQQNFIKEVIRQKANISNILKLNEIVKVIFDNVETNIKLSDALKLSKNIIKLKMDNVSMYKLPGKDSNESNGWFYVCDKPKADEIIKQYFTANGTFVNNTNNTNKTDKEKNIDNKVPAKAVPKPAPKPSAAPSVTKENPSNNDAATKSPPKDAP